jgi:hypothetical protein
VKDYFNNPVGSGVTVTYTAPVSGASTTFPGGTQVTTTDASGKASLPATANTVAGVYGVNASVAGVASPASFTMTNTPGAAAAVNVFSGSPQSTPVDTAFPNPLVAVVTDAFGKHSSR